MIAKWLKKGLKSTRETVPDSIADCPISSDMGKRLEKNIANGNNHAGLSRSIHLSDSPRRIIERAAHARRVRRGDDDLPRPSTQARWLERIFRPDDIEPDKPKD